MTCNVTVVVTMEAELLNEVELGYIRLLRWTELASCRTFDVRPHVTAESASKQAGRQAGQLP